MTAYSSDDAEQNKDKEHIFESDLGYELASNMLRTHRLPL